jgi:hypothetical protein
MLFSNGCGLERYWDGLVREGQLMAECGRGTIVGEVVICWEASMNLHA